MTKDEPNKFYKQSRWTYNGKQECSIASESSAFNTQLSTTDKEDAVLDIIGRCLFKYKLIDWKSCKNGVSDKDRKAFLRPLLGDRYAYAIVQSNNQQLALQKRNIEADRKLKEQENKVYEKRMKQARKWLDEHPDVVDAKGKKPTKKQYNPLSYEEFGRYQHNKAVLIRYNRDDFIGVTFGGKNNQRIAVRAIQLDPDDPDAQAKHKEWKLSRYDIKAIGDSSHACGNSVVRVDADGKVRILVPEEVRVDTASALGKKLESGKYLVLEKAAVFHYGWDVLLESIKANRSVTSSITYEDGAWHLTSTANSSSATNKTASEAASDGGSVAQTDKKQSFASGKDNPAVMAREAVKMAKKEAKKATVSSQIDRSNLPKKDRSRYLGIDVNDGHLDLCVCDIHGNPCGKAITLEFRTDGTSKQIKSSILRVLDYVRFIAKARNISCVFIESLNGFLDCKSRALNDGGRAFRRAVHRIPTGELRDWITRKLTFGTCHVELVPAAYTSKCGEAYWSDLFASSHQAAALMIARRGLGLGLFRRMPGSPSQSSVTGPVSPQDSLGGSDPVTEGERVLVGQDFSEDSAKAVDDICYPPTCIGTFSRVPRRSCRLRILLDEPVPR